MNRYSVTQKKYFDRQLKDGKIYERRAAKRISELRGVAVLYSCDDYRYDFITSDNIKYEVKHDKASALTGNIFIECLSNGQPSGILTTEAQYYIIVSDDIYYLILTDKLKQMINEKLYIRPASTNITCKTDGFLFDKQIIISNSEAV